MAYENLCLYCFEDNGGQDVCPHCGRDARAAVPQVQLLPGTLLYNERFLVGRALGQDASGIVYAALDTKRGVKIRIREYLPRDSARRLNSGEVVPESGQEDTFEAGMKKLRASVEGVEDPGKRHFFFEENGTGYIAQRKASGGMAGEEGDEEKRGPNMALVVGVAAALVLAVAVGVIMLVNFLTNRTDTKAEAPQTSSEDIWTPPESPTPTPYAEATFGTITDPEQSWMDFTNPDLKGDNTDYATPTPVPTAESGFSTDKTINASSSTSEIKNLQKLLTNLGWLASGNVTGVYDSATKQAVKDAQQYINDTYAFSPKLSVDGVAGPKTLAWLVKVDLVAKPTPTPAPITPNPTQAQQVIDENSSKEEIKYIQGQLAILGLMDANQIDGVYGNTTRAAVLYFQQRVNDLQGYDALPETGTADATTIAYLEYYVKWWQDKQSQTAAPSATPTAAPTLPSDGEVIDESSPAASIKAVQEMLIALGYLNGTADGSYGSKTYAAVKSFQNFINVQHGNVVSVTGKTDEVTRNYLEYYYDNLTEPTPTPTAALGAPTITVAGAATQANGVYYVGTSGAKIAWSATGADSYALALQDDAGTVVRKMESTKSTSLDFPQSYLTSSGTFTFTVIAIPAGGSASTGQRASVSLQIESAQATATPTAAPTAAPSPTPASLKPEITVTGAQGYQDGIYQISADGAVISWTSSGAGAYSLYVTDENDEILSSQKNTAITSYQLEASGMQAGKVYTFSVLAIPTGGAEKDGEYSSVRLTLASGVGVTPEPTATPAVDVEAPVISVTGQLGERDGIYWVGDEAITVSWSAAGHVRAYSVYLKNAQGAVLKQEQETNQTSLSVNPTAMTAGQPYEVEVVAIPEGGSETEGKSASVDIQLYAGETAEPTQTPVGTVETPVVTVTGYEDFADGVYYAGSDGLSFSWSAAGSVASYDLIITGSDGSTLVDTKGVTKTSGTLGFSSMTRGVLYTLTVTAVPEGGTSADGKSASVQMAVYEQQEVGTPSIAVTGAAAEENGGYWVGSDDIVISWSADNAASYDVTVEKSDGTSRSLLTGSTDTSLTVQAADFLDGVTYRVTVTAIPAGGTAADGKSASVLLARQASTPEVGTPVLSVSGAASQENGVYYAGTESLTVSWSADNAAKYGVYLLDSSNKVINSEQNTDKTSLTLKPENMAVGETYTITVISIPDGGEEKDGKSASVQLMRPAQQVPEVGTPQISVSGQAGEQNGVYLVGEDSIGVSWSADNAAAYSVYVYDGSGGLVNSSEKTEDTGTSFNPTSFSEGQTYKLTVVAIPAGGEEADGKSASVSFLREAQEAPVVGTPMITVSGYVGYVNETYYKGDDNLTLSWSADNAASYRAILTDSSGSTVLDTDTTTETSASLTSNKLVEGEIYTLTVYAAPAGGSSSDVKSASVMIALEVAAETQPPVADYIDKNSDATAITAMQTALYNLGWLSADAVAEKGTFGPLTRQAVYDYQTYVATEGINPEITIIDPVDENATVDAGTLTTLYDATNPVAKPQG